MILPTVEQQPLPGILTVSTNELQSWLIERNQPGHRRRQIQRWLYVAGAESFEQMTDLPKLLREDLAASFVPLETHVVRHLQAADGTHKLVVRLRDQRLIECVLIQEVDRRTACISTQVGCGMGCVFCASGINGVERNLTVAELVEQLLRLRNLAPLVPKATGAERLTNIVVMGMGEPLANLDNLLAALDLAAARDGLGIGARHITISTVGLPVKMRQLADTGRQYNLAVSLHAPNDELRNLIVPTNPKTGLRDILDAADYFFEKTGRQVTYEYVLLREMNDSALQARELASLLQGRCAHVNLIPFNDVEGLPYRRPMQEALNVFVDTLRRASVSVKVRKRKGSEIDAACGQLRREVQAEAAVS